MTGGANPSPNTDTTKPFTDVLASYLKLAASSGGVLYVLGFLIVSVHLSQYNLTSFSLLKFQYILAGAWAVMPFLFTFIIGLLTLSLKRAPKGRKFRIFAYVVLIAALTALSATAIFTAIFVAYANDLGWADRAKIGASCFFVLMLFLFLRIFPSVLKKVSEDDEPFRHSAPKQGGSSGGEKILKSETLARGILSFTILVPAIFVYITYFADKIYPLIPSHLGGGSPIEMRLILKESAPIYDGLKKGTGSELSPPLKLLLTSDKSYFIVAPDGSKRSLELPKDSVSLAVFGPGEKPKEGD